MRDLSDQPWVKYLAAANREFASTQGHIWGLSVTSWTAGPIYNVDLLHKAGYSQPPATWADFLKLCDHLKGMKVTPVYDTAVPPPGALLVGLIGGYYKRNYGKNIDSELLTGKISFVDAWTEPLTAYSELYTQGLVSTAYLGLTGTEIDSLMAEGKLGIYASGTLGRSNDTRRQSLSQAAHGAGAWPECGPGLLDRVAERGVGGQREGAEPGRCLGVLVLHGQPSGFEALRRRAGVPVRHVELLSTSSRAP